MEKFKKEKETLLMVSFISISIFGLGLFFLCLSAWLNKPIFDYLAVACWIAAAVPFMVLQFFVPFRIEKYLEKTWTIIVLVIFCIFELVVDFYFLFWVTNCFSYYLHVSLGPDFLISVTNPHQFLLSISFGSLGLLCLLFDLGAFFCLVIKKVKISKNNNIVKDNNM